MPEIPPFDKAVSEFTEFLRRNGYCGPVAWAFRQDFYAVRLHSYRIRWPLPGQNEAEVMARFEQQRQSGYAGLEAFCRACGHIVATLSPTPEEIDGLCPGLRLSVRAPLGVGATMPNWLWPICCRTPSYRRYQEMFGLAPRSWSGDLKRGSIGTRDRGLGK